LGNFRRRLARVYVILPNMVLARPAKRPSKLKNKGIEQHEKRFGLEALLALDLPVGSTRSQQETRRPILLQPLLHQAARWG